MLFQNNAEEYFLMNIFSVKRNFEGKNSVFVELILKTLPLKLPTKILIKMIKLRYLKKI